MFLFRRKKQPSAAGTDIRPSSSFANTPAAWDTTDYYGSPVQAASAARAATSTEPERSPPPRPPPAPPLFSVEEEQDPLIAGPPATPTRSPAQVQPATPLSGGGSRGNERLKKAGEGREAWWHTLSPVKRKKRPTDVMPQIEVGYEWEEEEMRILTNLAHLGESCTLSVYHCSTPRYPRNSPGPLLCFTWEQ
ncbi:hypothetical protein CALCODRAFT_503577 [Calocera cornea HHB12733]|uniref:Uncharacterized protein n=1 Tax=Calocera cornea HHB12733 TaxID=1353952 RepID=A0A165CU69_9BASI|nr:hypothetical protein CALCODRAFT_503577 [Calocera cornea HHB12733]